MVKHLPQHNGQRVERVTVKNVVSCLSMISKFVSGIEAVEIC